MLRPASRLLLRPSPIRAVTRATPSQRFLSTAPPSQKSRSFKNYAARLAIAGGLIYYYNTTDIFAEEAALQPRSAEYENEPDNLPTIEALAEQRKQQREKAAELAAASATAVTEGASGEANAVEQLEQEAGQEGAFNPETGEINWDCPCLGGMAHGPCGEEFKTAFSCFVFSEADPKGMDCIDKFQGMQNCFRQHPDVYGAELEEDDEYEANGKPPTELSETVPDTQVPAGADSPEIRSEVTRPKITAGEKVAARSSQFPAAEDRSTEKKRENAQQAKQHMAENVEPEPESRSAVPKSSHDTS